MSAIERAARCRRGQAATETILLTWIMIVFFAATYQIFLANHTISRTMTASHELLFEQAFDHNCASAGDSTIFSDADIPDLVKEVMRLLGLPEVSGSATHCRYQKNPAHATLVWSEETLPEMRVPVVGLLERHGLTDPLVLEPRLLQIGAGPDGPGTGIGHFQGLPRFAAKILSTSEWAVQNFGNILQWEFERLRPVP